MKFLPMIVFAAFFFVSCEQDDTLTEVTANHILMQSDNLINVLTEGSDKLTLADMNEESANMLALETEKDK